MSGEAYRDYIAAPDYNAYRSYDDWVSHRRERREVGLPPTEFHAYKVDDKWDWRDTEESMIEDLILGSYGQKADDWLMVGLLGTIASGIAWFVLEIMLVLIFNRNAGDFVWEVPVDTGLIILFALCGTVLGSVAMWCVTTYRLRMAQLQERKEIRQAEVDKEMWKRLPMESMQKAISNK